MCFILLDKKTSLFPGSGFMVYFSMREFIIYQDDDDNWVAECKELPGYRATGKTKDEALKKMQSAILIYHPCRCED
ncbi:MAG: type II toxin-antitoxin system HicB family antitoxin [Nitrospirota bacterium]|nr:type II toxin-antitoxin system HicB family antitoxin [Nitrospirota bacterium]